MILVLEKEETARDDFFYTTHSKFL